MLDIEYLALVERCRLLPEPKGNYRISDFVENLLRTPSPASTPRQPF